MGLQRVRHNLATKHSTAIIMSQLMMLSECILFSKHFRVKKKPKEIEQDIKNISLCLFIFSICI